MIALPELYGPSVRGIPLSEHGFIRVDRTGMCSTWSTSTQPATATDFPVKHGGVGSQQADAVAQSIVALAGARSQPSRFTR